jgi:phage terminase small subunit
MGQAGGDMKGPTLNERNWIERYLETGNATQAAKDAGYSAKTASVKGCQLRRKFAREIGERVAANFRDKSPRMAKIIEELAETANNEQVRYKAAADYLDRGGFKPTEKYEEVKPQRPYEEMVSQLAPHLPDLLRQIWPKMSPDQQRKCLAAIGIDPSVGGNLVPFRVNA